MKRKTITLVVYMLVCISLVSVGFAAWVITGGDQIDDATGNVTASTVHDESVYLEGLGWDSGNSGTIKFGAPAVANLNTQTGWLQTDSTAGDEDLTAVYYFKVKLGTSAEEDSYVSGATGAVSKLGTCTLTLEEGSSIKTLRDNPNNLIGESSIKFYVGASKDAVEDAEENSFTAYTSDAFKNAFTSNTSNAKELYVAVMIKYSWGSAFGGLNPYKYYETKAAKDYKEEAQNRLQLIDDSFNGVEATEKLDANEIILHIAFNSKGN